MTSKQLYSFTKDKACERSTWKRLWGTRNIELEGKYFSSSDYIAVMLHLCGCSLTPRLRGLHSSSQWQESSTASRLHHYYHLTGIATNSQCSQSVRAMICANPIPACAHRRKPLPASSSSAVWSWGTKWLQIGHPFSYPYDLLRQ